MIDEDEDEDVSGFGVAPEGGNLKMGLASARSTSGLEETTGEEFSLHVETLPDSGD